MSQDPSQQVSTDIFHAKVDFMTRLVIKLIHIVSLTLTLMEGYHNIYLTYLPQVPLPPNGQLQAYGLPPGQSFPVMMPPMGHALPGQPLPGSTGPPGFPGVYPPHSAAQQQVDI